MPGFTTEARNQMLDALGVTHAALFDGDPESGGTEITGGGYARQAVTLDAAISGSKDASNTPSFSVPADATVAFIAWFDASSGGNLLAKYELGTPQDFADAGTMVLTAETFSIT